MCEGNGLSSLVINQELTFCPLFIVDISVLLKEWWHFSFDIVKKRGIISVIWRLVRFAILGLER